MFTFKSEIIQILAVCVRPANTSNLTHCAHVVFLSQSWNTWPTIENHEGFVFTLLSLTAPSQRLSNCTAPLCVFLAALSVCVCCGLPGLILELALMLHTVVSFATQWQWVKLWSSLCFFSTRGPWCHHCRRYYLHPAAGHLGECTLLPLQKGQDLWPIWQTRPVSKTRDMTWDMS